MIEELRKLEEEAIRKKYPSNVNNYRVRISKDGITRMTIEL